MHSRFLDLIN